MPDDDPAEGPEGESDDSDDRSEDEASESTGENLSPEEPGDPVDPDDSDTGSEEATPSEESPEDPSEEESGEEELSPEELAEEVLEDVDTGEEEPSPEEDESTPEEPAGEPTEEETEPFEEEPSPEELADDVLEDVDTGEEQPESPASESEPEDEEEPSLDDVFEEEGGEEELSPEELAEEVLEDVETGEEEPPPEEPVDESAEEEAEPSEEEPSPEDVDTGEEEPSSSEPGESVGEEPSPEESTGSSEDAGDEPDEESSPDEPPEDVPDDLDSGDEGPESPESESEPEDEEEPSLDDVFEEEGGEEELSPEELAEDVLEDVETGEEEPSPEVPAEESAEEEDEPEEAGDREETSEAEGSPEEEPSTEDIVDDVLQEEAEDEDVSPEELAEEVLSEEEEGSAEEPEQPDEQTSPMPDEDRAESETADETTAPEGVPESEEETEFTEEAETEGEESESDEGASIQDMLEQEAEKAREVEEEDEEEDELPEGYLTVEQLPEEEEFEVPAWVKRSGWFLLYGVIGLLVGWYLLLPLWETFLLNQVKASMDRGQPEDARSWVDWGTGSGSLLIRNDDAFRADYLQQLLDAEALGRFADEYERLNNFDPSPYMNQAFTQYLINQGEWSRGMNQAEDLQQWVRTRGQGYLLHGKAALEQGQYEQVEADASRATQWLGNHPGTKRLLRDLRFRQEDYETSLQLSNELQGLVEENVHWSMKVRDYLQLARINKELDRHRVAQRMLERALDLDPRNEGVMRDLGAQYLLEGRQERAEPMINGTGGRSGYRKLYPLNAFGWWGGAELAQSEDRPARSIRFIERAEDLAPRNAEVRRVKGEVYAESLDRPEQAVPEFKRARELGIDRLRLVNSLAQAQYRAGQYEGAVEVYSTLREHVSDTRPDIVYNLGSSYLGAGDFERAEELIRQAHEQGYRNQNSFNQWGLTLEMQGERQRALAKYVEGIEWGERNNKPIGRVRKNLNRALAQDSPSPPTDWLAPVESDLGFAPWATLDQSSNEGTGPSP